MRRLEVGVVGRGVMVGCGKGVSLVKVAEGGPPGVGDGVPSARARRRACRWGPSVGVGFVLR